MTEKELEDLEKFFKIAPRLGKAEFMRQAGDFFLGENQEVLGAAQVIESIKVMRLVIASGRYRFTEDPTFREMCTWALGKEVEISDEEPVEDSDSA